MILSQKSRYLILKYLEISNPVSVWPYHKWVELVGQHLTSPFSSIPFLICMIILVKQVIRKYMVIMDKMENIKKIE